MNDHALADPVGQVSSSAGRMRDAGLDTHFETSMSGVVVPAADLVATEAAAVAA